jgi:hypothetical protein
MTNCIQPLITSCHYKRPLACLLIINIILASVCALCASFRAEIYVTFFACGSSFWLPVGKCTCALDTSPWASRETTKKKGEQRDEERERRKGKNFAPFVSYFPTMLCAHFCCRCCCCCCCRLDITILLIYQRRNKFILRRKIYLQTCAYRSLSLRSLLSCKRPHSFAALASPPHRSLARSFLTIFMKQLHHSVAASLPLYMGIYCCF